MEQLRLLTDLTQGAKLSLTIMTTAFGLLIVLAIVKTIIEYKRGI